MDILQLRYFYESAKTESFTKTAEAFQVPTTSVSASVKRLEKELGCPLFDRTSNRITLNADGHKFYKSMGVIFTELDTAVQSVSTTASDPRPIRILIRAMRRKLTDQIVRFRSLHPNVSFRTSFDFRETDFSNYDIIIDEDSDRYVGFELIPLYNYPLRIKCASTDPMCNKILTLSQLAEREFVSMGEGSNLHRILLETCNKAGFTPKISVLCNDIECYEKLIICGMGIAVGREKSSPEPGIHYMNVTDFQANYQVNAYCAPNSNSNARNFLNFIL